MGNLEDFTSRIRRAVGDGSGLGKTIKFELKGEGYVFVDGSEVSNENHRADLTVTTTVQGLMDVAERRVDPVTAVLTGAVAFSDAPLGYRLRGELVTLLLKLG